MKIRKYFFTSLMFVFMVGAFVHFKYEKDLTVDFFGNSLMLPLSMWFTLPLFLLLFASVLHIIYYSAKGYFKKRSLQKDHKNLIETIKRSLLSEKSSYQFKNDQYKNIGKLLASSKIILQDLSIKTNMSDIDNIIELHQNMQDNKGVNLKPYNLNENNEYRLLNIKNKINEDLKYAKEVLRNNTSYTQEILRLALEKIITSKSENDIKNGIKNVSLDKNLAMKLLELYNQELHLSYQEIKDIITEAKFSNVDFVELAKKLKKTMIPDDMIVLFNNLSDDFDNAKDGYIYVLLDLEMLQIAREYLENIEKDELVTFKAYLILKDSGHNYKLDNFIKGIY